MDSLQTTTPTPGTLRAPDDAATTRLAELLAAELVYDPVARGGFINHLAMSLVAAWRLGATAEQLDEWFRAQTGDDFLVPRDPPPWLDGDTGRIERRGIDAEVRDRLPALVGSPGTQFFHAIIRLEHAIDAGHAGQVANALRNWEDHADTQREPPTGNDGRTADQVLEEVARVAVLTYLEQPDIGSLHLVTGTRAARAVVALLDDVAAVTLALALEQAVARRGGRLYPNASAAPATDPGARSTGLPDWSSIDRAALDSHDPHVVKLVHSAHSELARTGDARYQQAAATATDLI